MNISAESDIDILLVEDDERLADLTARYLEQNHFSVKIVTRGDLAIAAFKQAKPKLVLLDLMLPGLDGLSICRQLRSHFSGPILILTANDSDIDQVICLESGADDFLTKPTDPMVLLARIRVLLRRIKASNHTPEQDIHIGNLSVSFSSQEVYLNSEHVLLTTHEFELLALLVKNAGKILSRDDILKNTRGINYDGLDRSIDVRISKLRKKLKDDGPQPLRIKTVWGKGYLLAPDSWEQ